MAAPTVSTTAIQADGSANISLPSGAVSGDLLLAIIYNPFSTTAFTPPTGWTEVVDATYNATFCRMGAFWIIRGGSAPAVAIGGGSGSSTAIFCYRIATGTFDAVTPMDATPTTNNQGGTANPSAPTITTVTADTLWVVATGNDATTQTVTGPSGFTELSATGGAKSSHKAQAAIGATGTAQFTSASQEWGSMSIAVRPAGGGAAATSFPPVYVPTRSTRALLRR